MTADMGPMLRGGAACGQIQTGSILTGTGSPISLLLSCESCRRVPVARSDALAQ
jgi:hypothetical protein